MDNNSLRETNKKKLAEVIIGVLVLALLVAGYFYFFKKSAKHSAGVVETAKQASQSVPQIITNPAEKVPEVNPLDRANPFRYNNPLR